MNREEAFKMLEVMEVAKVELEFYGGNDEGFVEGMTFYDDQGEKMDIELAEQPFWEKKKVLSDKEQKEEELGIALEQPIYDTWGGFAGDFSVYGTMVWDVPAKKVYEQGAETQYVDFEREV